MSRERMITVYGRADKAGDMRAGGFEYLHKLRYGTFQVKATELRKHINDFLQTMRDIVDTTPQVFGDLELETVSFTVEVSTKGTVKLLGTGGEAAGKGGLTFTLRRTQTRSGKS